MLREDREYQISAEANLDEAIQSSYTTTRSAVPTIAESRSENDLETEIAPPISNDRASEYNRKVQDAED